MEKKTCQERVEGHYRDRIGDLKKLWEAWSNGEEGVEDVGSIFEYGLCFDYVAPGTFTDQQRGYFRYQLSTGGPGDEFRFYTNPDFSVYEIKYWFLDWYDGASIAVARKDWSLLENIFGLFSVEEVYKQAMEG